jgi:hypothetical protein
MNCYVGLAKRIAKSCFPELKPVPQLEPLDAKNIIKQEVKDISTNKACFALSDAHERLFKPISFKPISDEEAWEATLAWAEAKAQERETKAASQTDTDESYDSDEFEVGVSIHPVDRRPKSALFAGSDTDDHEYDDIEEFTRTKWEQIAAMIAIWGAKERAATMIQAATRGRAVRLVAWFAALDAALLMRVRVRKERRRAAKETRRAWNTALDPTTWYRV